MTKTKLKQKTQQVFLITIISFLLLTGIGNGIYSTLTIIGTKTLQFKKFTIDYIRGCEQYGCQDNFMVIVPKAKAKEKEPPIKEWIKQEIKNAGLNWEIAECIIKHESNFDNYAIGWNTNGTIDYGIWQINSCHKKTISVKDRLDYKLATKWAINKRITNGDWGIWTAYNKFCN